MGERNMEINRNGEIASLDEVAFASVAFGGNISGTGRDDDDDDSLLLDEIDIDIDIELQDRQEHRNEKGKGQLTFVTLRSFFLFCVMGILATVVIAIVLQTSYWHPPEDINLMATSEKVVTASAQNGLTSAHTGDMDDSRKTHGDENSKISRNKRIKKVVPFANRHNLRFNGLLFVKEQDALPVFDAYTKTLDPVTELHFSPGESTTTKEIILSTTAPDLIGEQHEASKTMPNQNAVLSIRLQSNGQLLLPHNTLELAEDHEDFFATKTRGQHRADTIKIHKNIYGPGDSFVLEITRSAITLFRNDHNELIGMWANPTEQIAATGYPVPLYAQVWFKTPNSSMMAYAFNDGS